MNLGHAFILGIVEGITEFLPISSTGHLILAGRLLGLPESEFLKSFNISIQLGAILAVVVLYGRSLLVRSAVIKRVLAAFIPTALVGGVLYKVIKKFLLGNSEVVIWSLFLGGVFLLVFEKVHRENRESSDDISTLSYRDAVWIGLFQAVAMIPGVSRAAATIIGGLILGMRRKTIVEFSFLLAVPTMLAASVLDLLKSAPELSFNSAVWSFFAVGFLTSFVVAMLSIKLLLQFIQRHNFTVFGYYRILVAVCFWLWVK